MTKLRALKLDKGERSKFAGFLVICKFFLFLALFAALFFLVFLFFINKTGTTTTSVVNFVLNKEPILKAEDNRINVLLLGIPGGTHDGATLSDTIMVASYDLLSKEGTLISLPRDLWIDEHKVKVNALYQTGEKNGEGLEFVRKEIGRILGITIPYAVRLDFSGFVKAVDLVGGIDIEVAKSFDDYFYPVPGKEKELCGYTEVEKEIGEEEAKSLGVQMGKLKVLLDKDEKIATSAAEQNKDIVYDDQQVFRLFPCRFEHLSYKQGLTYMDGETALKFVRSRHGTNSEGSDFARSRRQQLVLQSFKEKILSLETLTDPQKIGGLIETFGDSVETDIVTKEYLDFYRLVKEAKGFSSTVIDGSGKDPLLITPRPSDFGGAWVLVPKGKDYTKIHQYVASVFSGSLEASEGGEIKVKEASSQR